MLSFACDEHNYTELKNKAEFEYIQAWKIFEYCRKLDNFNENKQEHILEIYEQKLLTLKELFKESMEKDKNGNISDRKKLFLMQTTNGSINPSNPKVNKAKKQADIFIKLIRKLNDQVNLSKITVSELSQSSALMSSARNQFLNITALAKKGKSFVDKYEKRKLVDLFIISVLIIIFLSLVIH
ncbi:hypothetical protein HZS_4740, partial [Henneguya salminicola]